MESFDTLWDFMLEEEPSSPAPGNIPVIFRRTCGGIHTTITVYHPGLIRVQKGFSREYGRDLPFLNLPCPQGEVQAILDESLQAPSLPETLYCGNLRMDLTEDGALCLRREPGSVYFQEVTGRHLISLDGQLIHSFQLDKCLYYGFGEKTGPLEKTGHRMRFAGKDACGYDPEHTDPLYKHVPFFIKMTGDGKTCTGVFYHTAAGCQLDMGREYNGYYPPMGQFVTAESWVDYFLIPGSSMGEVLDTFTQLTGRPGMLPKYALGYLGSSMYYPELPEGCHEEIVAFVEKAKRLGIPCSNFQLSSGYTTDSRNLRNVFSWNREKFPDPGRFVRDMEAAGAPITPNVKPAMLTTNPLYDTFRQAGAFIRNGDGSPYVTRFWGGEGSFVDFTNPDARKLWKDMLKENLLNYGIRSIWNDNNEFDLTGGICFDEGRFTPAPRLRAVLPLLMAQTGFEALQECRPGQRPYQVSRSGCAGINRYAQVWTGDNRTSWQSLKWNIATMLGSGLSGMPLTGSDVGGFAGPAPGKELFLRWIACGVLMPRFSIHSANDDNTVTEPWMYPSAMDAVRGFFRLRQRLMPYLYTLHYEANQTGSPIWRPMVWQYPRDSRCQRENVDFFLGDGLLCACVVDEGALTRKVWLPEGSVFYDFFTRQRFEGGRDVTLDAPVDKVILLQKGGSIVPTEEQDGLHLWICPEEDCELTHYDDCGDSSEGQKISIFRLVRNGDFITLTRDARTALQQPLRQLNVQCRDIAPSMVAWDHNHRLRRYLDDEGFDKCREGWYYDPETKLCAIRCPQWESLVVYLGVQDLIKIDGDPE